MTSDIVRAPVDSRSRQRSDAVVVGSGAAGGIAAHELARCGASVTVLEAGSWASNSSAAPGAIHRRASAQHVQSRCGECDGPLRSVFVDDHENPYASEHEPFTWLRCRAVGGRTLVWNDVCLRLSEQELAGLRPGLSAPWPLDVRELGAAYDHVSVLFGVIGEQDFSAANPGEREALASRPPGAQLSMVPYAANIAVGDAHATSAASCLRLALESGRARLRHGAVASRVVLDPQGRARGVEFVDAKTRELGLVEAKLVILAASTLESTRILLNSSCSRHPQGLGNSAGVLGRYLSDHLMLVGVEGRRVRSGAAAYGPTGRGVLIRALDTSCPFQLQAYFYRDDERETVKLVGFAEAQSCPDNRVQIEESLLDAWGIPALGVQYRRTALDVELGRAMTSFAHALVERWGYQLTSRGGVSEGGLSAHEVGTARMSASEESGVVDTTCQVYGVPGLLVLDGAVFPSAGYANPTLTIMAVSKLACDAAWARMEASR